MTWHGLVLSAIRAELHFKQQSPQPCINTLGGQEYQEFVAITVLVLQKHLLIQLIHKRI